MRLENKVAVVVGAGQTPGSTIGNGPRDLALASDEAGFVTGAILPVDGGQSTRVG